MSKNKKSIHILLNDEAVKKLEDLKKEFDENSTSSIINILIYLKHKEIKEKK